MEGLQQVAVKIHQLNTGWSGVKKASYVKHAVREYNIHRTIRHSRVVALLDIFEIDSNTFATVLELCDGGDLDSHLKEHQVNSSLFGALCDECQRSKQGNHGSDVCKY